MAQRLDVRYIRMYTDGSAARKIEVAGPSHKPAIPRPKKKKKIILHVDPVAIFGIMTAVVMLIIMMVSMGMLMDAQENTRAMESYVEKLQTENQRLRTEYEEGYDVAEVERTALALGMVPREQVRHVNLSVKTPNTAPTADAWDQIYVFLAGLFA